MTTEQTTAPAISEGDIEPTEAPDANAELRAHNKRLKDENKTLRAGAIGSALEKIGLDPERMVGKAIAKEYNGEMTVDAIGAFALEEYGYEGTTEQTPPAVETGDRLTQLESVSEPITPAEPVDRDAEITSEMDNPEAGREEAAASINAKSNQFYSEHYGDQT